MPNDSHAAFALIVEDHPLVADSLVSCIHAFDPQIEAVIAESLHAAERVLAQRPAPKLIITDLMLTDARNTQAVSRLRAAAPDCPLLVFTALEDPQLRIEAEKSGATAYLIKSSTTQTLRNEVQTVLGAHHPAPGAASTQPRASQLDDLLTKRQQAVLEELAAGRSNKEIALRLKVSDLTVHAHVKEIFGRLAVKNRTEAAIQYFLMAGQSQHRRSRPEH